MTPAALTALVDAGATVEMLAAAWMAEMLSEDTRTSGAKRQARYRERHNASQTVTEVTEVTEGDAPLSPSPSSPHPPQQPHPYTRVNNTRTRGTRISEDFELPEEWRHWAEKEKGWSEAVTRDEGSAFGDFWRAKAGKDGAKLDWQATWRNWCRNSRKQGSRRSNGHTEWISPC